MVLLPPRHRRPLHATHRHPPHRRAWPNHTHYPPRHFRNLVPLRASHGDSQLPPLSPLPPRGTPLLVQTRAPLRPIPTIHSLLPPLHPLGRRPRRRTRRHRQPDHPHRRLRRRAQQSPRPPPTPHISFHQHPGISCPAGDSPRRRSAGHALAHPALLHLLRRPHRPGPAQPAAPALAGRGRICSSDRLRAHRRPLDLSRPLPTHPRHARHHQKTRRRRPSHHRHLHGRPRRRRALRRHPSLRLSTQPRHPATPRFPALSQRSRNTNRPRQKPARSLRRGLLRVFRAARPAGPVEISP